VLNTWNRFAVPAITPALLNIAFIVAAVFFAKYFDPPIVALAWAVFAGACCSSPFKCRFSCARAAAALAAGSFTSGRAPRAQDHGAGDFGVSVAQISLLINTIFASYFHRKCFLALLRRSA